ncbi:hypothetical protein SAMN05428949_3029 [Chitinophaga sp. YR627]|uniref:DUF6268 family outer membrane beta-barrel protein n=1 Tax=Chitinophaga sp. YR627 TaxID=1881041 RepID=UPI0008DFD716|nr:DUF6268 family outer membrane beta-barrel protein [Chitinophaga sp. YR627]SFN49472.1 hypothetical protein SAMN05428949_3029 [Chitinophaga sp. YR627]
MKSGYQRSIQSRYRAKQIDLLTAFVIAIITLLSGPAFSQGYIEGVNISYEHMPMKIETPHGDQKFTGSNFKIATTIPIFLTPNKSKYLLVGGNLEAFNFSGTHPDFDVKRVYSISPTLGYSTMVNRSFNLTFLFTPTMNSDYKDVKTADINFGAVVRGSWKVSENLTWRGILGYRRQFYGPQYVVLLGMDWKVNDKWRIFGDLPHSTTVSYAVNEKVNTGFNLFVQQSTYRLKNQQRYFEYNTVNPGLFAEYYVSPKWAVRATAAYTLIRNMEIYNKNDKADGFIDFYEMGDRKDPLNPEVASGLSFRIGLSYRIVPGRR